MTYIYYNDNCYNSHNNRYPESYFDFRIWKPRVETPEQAHDYWLNCWRKLYTIHGFD
jgi:hypothetical protein